MQYEKNILSEGLTTLKSKYMICGIWLLYDKMADYYFTNTQIIRLNLIEYFHRWMINFINQTTWQRDSNKARTRFSDIIY